MTENFIGKFFLHVAEIKSAYAPEHVPSICVHVIQTDAGLVEQVTLKDARLDREEWLVVQPPHGRASGNGWTLHDASRDGETTWRRPFSGNYPHAMHDASDDDANVIVLPEQRKILVIADQRE
jgi:hypothetical protein